jgi:hypothetical protein
MTNSMDCLTSVDRVITSLDVSGVSAAHHQEVECTYLANGTCYTSELIVITPGPLTVNSELQVPFATYTQYTS